MYRADVTLTQKASPITINSKGVGKFILDESKNIVLENLQHKHTIGEINHLRDALDEKATNDRVQRLEDLVDTG